MFVRKVAKIKDPRVDAQINELIRVINAFARRTVHTETMVYQGATGELRIRSATSGKAYVLRYNDEFDTLDIVHEA